MYDVVVFYYCPVRQDNKNVRIQFSSWNSFESEIMKHTHPKYIKSISVFAILKLPDETKIEDVYPENSIKD